MEFRLVMDPLTWLILFVMNFYTNEDVKKPPWEKVTTMNHPIDP